MMIEERSHGFLERSLVAGITAQEFLLTTLLIQSFILCFQTFLLLLLPYFLLSYLMPGPLTLPIALIFAQGLCGVALGLALSTITQELVIAALVLLSIYIISLIISGFVWPLHNIPIIVRSIGKSMPFSIPFESMRIIMYRQWTIDYFEVYSGFVVLFIWFLIFFITAFIFLRRKL